MKNLLLLVSLFLAGTQAIAQQDSISPPYLRFPNFPPVKLLTTDSVYFTKEDLPKKTPVLLMLFNPHCEHCQEKTRGILDQIDRFKKIRIIMTTTVPYDSMKAFARKYELSRYPNILVGRDIHYFLPGFFQISHLPFLAFYRKDRSLISVFEGAMPIPQILEKFEK